MEWVGVALVVVVVVVLGGTDSTTLTITVVELWSVVSLTVLPPSLQTTDCQACSLCLLCTQSL